MSTDNSIALSGREVETRADAANSARTGPDAEARGGQAGFEIPPELAARYQVRIIDAPNGGEQRLGLFLPGDRENPAIEIAGDRIVARTEDAETISALVKIAQHNGWDRIDVEGSPEFRKAMWAAATREGLSVNGYEPSFVEQEQLQATRRAAAVVEPKAPEAGGAVEPAAPAVEGRQSRPEPETAATVAPAPASPPARPDFDVGVEGTIVEVGRAKFDNKATRNTPYVDLELPDGRKERAWGVGLPDALQAAGSEVGDAVRLQRLGVQPVEVSVQVRDSDTGALGTEQRTVNRNRWAVEGRELDGDASRRSATTERGDDAQRGADATAAVERPTVKAAVDVGIAAIAAGVDRNLEARDQSIGSGTPELSDDDRRLLLTLSRHAEDRKGLYENLREDMDAFRAEVQYERIGTNRDALNGALERALESPTLVKAFERSGYEPDELRQMGGDRSLDGEFAEALYEARSGLNRHEVAVSRAAEREAGAAQYDEYVGEQLEGSVARSIAEQGRQREAEPQPVREEQARDAAAERRHESEELAELFLHGGAEKLAADPRLANALQAQTAMEQHIGEVFDGDASRMASANLESRQMISDALRRGLDVSVREPTPVRQIEPIQTRPDLER